MSFFPPNVGMPVSRICELLEGSRKEDPQRIPSEIQYPCSADGDGGAEHD